MQANQNDSNGKHAWDNTIRKEKIFSIKLKTHYIKGHTTTHTTSKKNWKDERVKRWYATSKTSMY